MIQEIICIGSSFTEGGGLNPNRDSKQSKWYSKKYNTTVTDKTHSFPAIIENITGIPTRNLGKCGTGLEWIIRNTEEILEEGKHGQLFVFDCSNWGRAELWSNDVEKYVVANWGHKNGENPKDGFATHITVDYNNEYDNTPYPNPDFKNIQRKYDIFLNHFMDEDKLLINLERQFLNLLYKLDAKGIPFRILESEPFYWEQLLKEKLITDNRIQLRADRDGFENCLVTTWDFLSTHQLSIRCDSDGLFDDGHAGVEGHKVIADLILKTIKDYETI